MKKDTIYPNQWLRLHPYTATDATDAYFVRLANRLYAAWPDAAPPSLPLRQRCCLYLAAYLEDLVSGLGLWKGFIDGHRQLYGSCLPFYPTDAATYFPDEPHREDVKFLLWNAWQLEEADRHPYRSPHDPLLDQWAEPLSALLDEAYEEAPENPRLSGYFSRFDTLQEADRKLQWLFRHTYLTEPALLPYEPSAGEHLFLPTGPLALFVHEWMALLAPGSACWQSVPGLYPAAEAIPEKVRQNHQTWYGLFTAHTGGRRIAYLDGYEALRQFLTGVLHWPDDEAHTLPHLRECHDFVLMAHPEKGILLAKDICACIASPHNPLYRREIAEKQAFRLLTEPQRCPPDLLEHCIRHHLLPDACLPETRDLPTVQDNMDFIARHSLLYYYRGD